MTIFPAWTQIPIWSIRDVVLGSFLGGMLSSLVRDLLAKVWPG